MSSGFSYWKPNAGCERIVSTSEAVIGALTPGKLGEFGAIGSDGSIVRPFGS